MFAEICHEVCWGPSWNVCGAVNARKNVLKEALAAEVVVGGAAGWGQLENATEHQPDPSAPVEYSRVVGCGETFETI